MKKSIVATIRIGQEIWCLPYAGFLYVQLTGQTKKMNPTGAAKVAAWLKFFNLDKNLGPVNQPKIF